MNDKLKTKITDSDFLSITTPEVLEIIYTIKKIQTRLKDPDVRHLQYIHVYDKLGKEFDEFFNTYTGIFVKVIRGENLNTVAAVLYYKDKIAKGLMTEEQLSDMLAREFLPANLKKESDEKLREMREKNIIANPP